MKPHPNLRSYIHTLQKENEIATITAEVDPHLEIAEIHRRAVQAGGKALLFTNVKGSRFPVATNLFGTEKRMELAFPDRPEKIIKAVISLMTGPLPPSLTTLWHNKEAIQRVLRLGTKKTARVGVTEKKLTPCDLHALPLLTCWPDDGGPFITLPLVYTEGVAPQIHQNGEAKKPHNLGMYRIQRFDSTTTGLHFQIGKGAGFHYLEAEKQNKNLPVSIFLGGPPALMLSAIAPLPENVPELLLASLLLGDKLTTSKSSHPHPIITECEFAIQGYAKPKERRLEGPFGDHYGYYGLAHEYPIFNVTDIYHKKDAIYPATVVGKPIQEDLYIGNYLQKLLAPIIPVVMPNVVDLWSYSETGFHPLAAARIKERYEKEALTAAFRIFGEGQLSLTKFLLLTDAAVDLSDIKQVLETILERCSFDEGFYIFGNTANDTLDYTGPKLNRGSKALLIGVGDKKRHLPGALKNSPPSPIKNAVVFCKGVLVVDGIKNGDDIEQIAKSESLKEWPLVFVVDDAKSATQSPLEFLWTTFTRFDPQNDITPRSTEVKRHHIQYEPPLIIDARMKAHYPKEALADAITKELVDRRWDEYGITR